MLFGLAPQDKLIVARSIDRFRTLFLDRESQAQIFAGAGD